MAPVVQALSLGPMANFVYLVSCPVTRQCVVVDPAWDARAIEAAAAAADLSIVGLVCTHGHFDHINAVDDLLARHDLPVHLMAEEAERVELRNENLVRHRGGDRLRLGAGELELLHTPGHTPGSLTVRLPEAIVTGDTLFVGGCGRCDLVGGDPVVMFDTLQRLCRGLPPETRVFPGHDYGSTPSSRLRDELRSNPYLQHGTLAQFVAHRMAPRMPAS